jgi:hypothetical protein
MEIAVAGRALTLTMTLTRVLTLTVTLTRALTLTMTVIRISRIRRSPRPLERRRWVVMSAM